MASRSEVQPNQILHPLVSLEWEECIALPVGMFQVQAVYNDGRIFIGGGETSSGRDSTKVYIFTPSTNKYETVDTPVIWFALAIFNSRVIVIGGLEYPNTSVTINKLYTINMVHGHVIEVLPPMPTRRYAVSAISEGIHLIVAGGWSGGVLDIVEVFSSDSRQWSTAHSLPKPCYRMKSTTHGKKWILLGGEGQGKDVYTVDVILLIQSSKSTEIPQLSSVWNSLTQVPCERSSPAVFHNTLISIGGKLSLSYYSNTVFAYSTHTKSWIHIGQIPTTLNLTCTLVLSTGELLVVGGLIERVTTSERVFKCRLRVSPFDMDSEFIENDLSRLEGGAGISLSNDMAVKEWIKRVPYFFRTWTKFFLLLRAFNMNQLAEQIENYMSMYSSPEGQEPLHSRDDDVAIPKGDVAILNQKLSESEMTVHQLRWEVAQSEATIKMVKEDKQRLMAEVEQLKTQLFQTPVKTEQVKEEAIGEEFCGMEGCEKRKYCASIYYLGTQGVPNVRHIHFVMTRNDETHRTITKEYYENELGAMPGPNSIVDFEKDKVKLEIEDSGISVGNDWRITPLTAPTVVLKEDVDTLKKNELMPSCQLEAEYVGECSERIPKLFHQVKLTGATERCKMFTISYHPQLEERSTRVPGTSRSLSADYVRDPVPYPLGLGKFATTKRGLDSTQMEHGSKRPKLSRIGLSLNLSNLELFKWKDDGGQFHDFRLVSLISSKWKKMARLLGNINTKSINSNDMEECCSEVLNKWIEDGSEKYAVSWDGLIKLLNDIQCSQIASELKVALEQYHKAC